MEPLGKNNVPQMANPTARVWHMLPVLLAIAVYANTLLNGFVYDDQMMITQNRIVQKGWAGIPELLTTPHLQGFMPLPGDGYRPLSLVMFAAEYALVGMQPWLGHAVNVALFALCVWLLQRFVVLAGGAQHATTAIVAAGLFAVLPVHTEVVANIKSRDELLSFALGLLVLTHVWQYVRDGKQWRLPVAMGIYLLALMAKENVVTLLVLAPLVACQQSHRSRLWVTVGAMVATLGAYMLITWLVLQHNGTSPGYEGTDVTVNALIGAPDPLTRLATAILGMGIYLKLLVIPYPLLCNYSYASIPYVTFGNVWVLLAVLAWGAIAVMGLYRLLKVPGDLMALGMVWLVVTISMFSNVVVMPGAQLAERFLFLPSAGYCIAVAAGLQWLASRSAEGMAWRRIAMVLLPVAVVYSGMAMARNRDWADDRTLFAHDMEQSPNDCRLAFFVAGHAAPPPGTKDVRAYDEQIALLRKALAIYPLFIQAHTTLAEVYETIGQYDSAYAHGIAALRQQPDNAAAAYITGRVLYAVKRYPEAAQWLQTAVRLTPGHKEVLLNMARCYDEGGVTDSAMVFYRRVLAIDARNVMAMRGLGLACLRMGKYEPAIVQLTQLAAMTGDADDGNNLGAALLSAGRLPEAVAQLRALLAANPNNAAACQNMVIAWKQMGQADSAAWYAAKCSGGTQ